MKRYSASIICPVRDEILTIDECLKSLVEQTYPYKEIIIVDDESTDGSSEIIKKYAKKYPKIKLFTIKHDESYLLKSRNTCIAKSSGDVLFVIDADAIYEPDYLKKCIKHLDKKNVGGVIGKVRVWKKKNTFISKYRDAHYRIRWDNPETIRRELSEGKIAPWVYKRKIYDEMNGYRREAGWSADIDFAKRLLAKGYILEHEPSVIYWHRWREGVMEFVKYTLFWSRLDFGVKKGWRNRLKNIYFFLYPPLIAASFFNPLLWILVGLHALPMTLTGVKLFGKAGKMKIPGRGYLLLAPVISYLTNVSYSYGYLSNYFWRPKK